MHTYKIYFRFYLLLLPLCLANIKMVAASWRTNSSQQKSRRRNFARNYFEFEILKLERRWSLIFITTENLVLLTFPRFRPCCFTQSVWWSTRSNRGNNSINFQEIFFALSEVCVIKYILKNLLNYPLTSSTTSWDRIILKLYTYCSIIQRRIFCICHSTRIFRVRKKLAAQSTYTAVTNTPTRSTLSNGQ